MITLDHQGFHDCLQDRLAPYLQQGLWAGVRERFEALSPPARHQYDPVVVPLAPQQLVQHHQVHHPPVRIHQREVSQAEILHLYDELVWAGPDPGSVGLRIHDLRHRCVHRLTTQQRTTDVPVRDGSQQPLMPVHEQSDLGLVAVNQPNRIRDQRTGLEQ